MGYTDGRGYVVKSEADIDALPEHIGEKVCFVSQTTMFTFDFKSLGAHLKRRFPAAEVVDTICGATKERQSDIPHLKAEGAQAVVVIGGRHSANTVKLAKLVEMEGMPCYHVETAAELDFGHMKGKYNVIGVTAGASTPGFLIDEVCNRLEAI